MPRATPDRTGPPEAPAPDKEFMTTLAKGLAVIELFGKGPATAMTLSRAASGAGVTRATARRILLTLERLGYVERRGREFALTPATLNLGFAYLSSRNWIEQAHGPMKALAENLAESCSLAVLDGTDVVYVARVQASRIMANAISIGTRLPAFHTALGRALLGGLDNEALWTRLRSINPAPYTPATILDKQALFERIRADAHQGFAIVDEELERGLRAIAVPLQNRAGETFAALNVSSHATRMTRNDLRERFLPALQETAAAIARFAL